MRYDPRRAEVRQIADRLAAARWERNALEPGSLDDLDSYRIVNELATELRQRRSLLDSARDAGISPLRGT